MFRKKIEIGVVQNKEKSICIISKRKNCSFFSNFIICFYCSRNMFCVTLDNKYDAPLQHVVK